MNCILWILSTRRRLFSGHSELLPWNKTTKAGSWPLSSIYYQDYEWVELCLQSFTTFMTWWALLYILYRIEKNVKGKDLWPFYGSDCAIQVQSVYIQNRYLPFTSHTLYHWYHLLCVGIYDLRFGFLPWNSSIGCIYFWRACTSGVCFREVFADAVRPPWYTLPNVYTGRSHQIFSPAGHI